MNNFKQTLYEALLVAFGKTLAKYNAFAQATILRDVGRELIDYLHRHGFEFEETGAPEDLARLTSLFVENGFAERLDVLPADRGNNYVWHNLYGRDAYQELHEVSDNPFLACPLNLCLYYLADKHHKTMRLLEKSFSSDGVVESQYEVVDQAPLDDAELDPLVLENARLYELARERAASLEAEIAQRKRTEQQLQAQKQELEKEIEERKRAELEVERVHRQLVEASRRAGQAEIAASVLHNIGNILNSVNVSTTIIGERLRQLRLANLARTAQMLQEHVADLPAFLATDERGRRLPEFLAELARHLGKEQTELLVEISGLERYVEHIKRVVVAQQTYTGAPNVTESANLVEVVDEAIHMHLNACSRNGPGLEIVRDLADVPTGFLERHRVTEILLNLLNNARQACFESSRSDKQVIIRVRPEGSAGVVVEVADNGIGIARENLTRIFAPGFTTRPDGHGFGLHSAALAAAEMGGTLTGHSEGPGRGATFVLRLPLHSTE